MSSSAAQVRGGQPERLDHPRVQLARVPGDPPTACFPLHCPASARSRYRAAQRPGCHGSCWLRAHGERHPAHPAAPCARPRSRPGTRPARPSPHQPDSSRSPGQHHREVQRLVGQRGLQRGHLLGRRAAVDAQDRRDRAVAPGRVRNTRPVSNRARSAKPRPTLRDSTRSSPGSSVVAHQRLLVPDRVRQPDGGAARVVGAQLHPVGVRGRAERALITSTNPAPARARPMVRRSRCGAVSPCPAVARGIRTGMFSYPSSRMTSSARSLGSVRSGRQDGGVRPRPNAARLDLPPGR